MDVILPSAMQATGWTDDVLFPTSLSLLFRAIMITLFLLPFTASFFLSFGWHQRRMLRLDNHRPLSDQYTGFGDRLRSHHPGDSLSSIRKGKPRALQRDLCRSR